MTVKMNKTYGHDQLMSSGYSLQTVALKELVCYVLPEGITSSTRRESPACLFIWIRPEQIAHWTFVRYLLDSFEVSNLVKSVETGG